ncbi:MAG: FUSC family protein, partial [Gammaproteobacteria bacterium]|nr:FUSC family protein [Gammaproteobacteria bacterium]
RISYAGFQIAFAFFLCLIQGSGPSFDLTVGRDRIIGIIIGNLVAYFIFVYVWPSSISRRVDTALAATFRRLAEVATAKGPAERRLLTSQAQEALSDIETDIELARYEPASIRRSAAWLATRQHVVKETQSLGTWLLLSADPREASRVAAVARLEQLAAGASRAADTDDIPSAPMPSAHGWQTLPARLNGSLRALEEILTPGDGRTEARTHAQA